MRTGKGRFGVGLQVSFGVFKNDTFAGRCFRLSVIADSPPAKGNNIVDESRSVW
jgi:hypothetical protein